MLLRDQPYHDLGPDWLSHRNDPSPHPPNSSPNSTTRPTVIMDLQPEPHGATRRRTRHTRMPPQ